MAYPIQSPGVDLTVIDESFYASAGQGTVPLIIIGTHEYKTQPDGTSIAAGTLPENANILYLISSQRELTQTFGNPVFYTNEGTPLDGYELNEYGLHAAYQYLAQANTAYVVRGAIDYSQLKPSASEPVSEPLGGTFWLNTATTTWGIFQSNGNTDVGSSWIKQSPIIISDPASMVYCIIGNHTNSSGSLDPTTPIITRNGSLVINGTTVSLSINMPLSGNGSTVGVVQAINNAIGSTTNLEPAYVIGLQGKAYLALFDSEKKGSLNLNGSDAQVLLDLGLTTGINSTTNLPNIVGPSLLPNIDIGNTGNFAINATYNNNVLFQKLQSFYKVSGSDVESIPVWYPVGSQLWTLASPNHNSVTFSPYYGIPSNSSSGDIWINTTPENSGANLRLQVFDATSGAFNLVAAPLYDSDASAIAGIGSLFLIPNSTVYIQYSTVVQTSNNTTNTIVTYTPLIWTGAEWDPLVYQAQASAPTSEPEDGTLWFHNNFQADIMVSTGRDWKGYRRAFPNTDPHGVILDASAPTTQTDNTPLVDNDLWINTSLAAQENYPQLYRYVALTKKWQLIDKTNNVNPKGIIFKDARYTDENGSQEPAAFAVSNYVDPDAPDPLLYPTGMLLFNTRFSSQNVKEWQSTQLSGLYENTDYTVNQYDVGETTFPPVKTAGRWVTASGNNGNVPYMGRKAQRQMVIKGLKGAVNLSASSNGYAANEDLLSESIYYTLIAAPGYPEMLGDLVSLNDSKRQLAFIVGDTPARLDPSGTSLSNWANNKKVAKIDGDDGIVTNSQFLSVYYPWGLSTNYDGSSIVVPPSTIALRTIVKSDNMSYVWYTPAGFTRGLVDNATSVGYINSATGIFKPVVLSPGQRDVLYQNKINAIAFMPTRGLVIMGDKTRSPVANAEDRINVARLVNYLRYNLDNIAKPFLFEPNVQHTQDSVRIIMERFLGNLVTLNAVYDFIVVCDASNNTDQRVNNNELWIDIAIQPVKTIDFIYIPLRIESKGTDLAALYSGLQGKS